jgi:hypothetical protein
MATVIAVTILKFQKRMQMSKTPLPPGQQESEEKNSIQQSQKY